MVVAVLYFVYFVAATFNIIEEEEKKLNHERLNKVQRKER